MTSAWAVRFKKAPIKAPVKTPNAARRRHDVRRKFIRQHPISRGSRAGALELEVTIVAGLRAAVEHSRKSLEILVLDALLNLDSRLADNLSEFPVFLVVGVGIVGRLDH